MLECDIAVESLAVDNNVSLACKEDKGEILTPVSSSEEGDVAIEEGDIVLLLVCANTADVFGCRFDPSKNKRTDKKIALIMTKD